MKYNWQQPSWPNFSFDLSGIEDKLYAFAEETGQVRGLMDGLSADLQEETSINQMVMEAIKTSEIEGEFISRQDVVSSIRNRLGLNRQPELIKDKRARGVGQLMVEIRTTFLEPLNEASLFSWHSMLMDGNTHLSIGQWRSHEEPMQIISGAIGHERVHFEAPPSDQVPEEMRRFIRWFNDTAPTGTNTINKAAVRAAIAHLYFESIHPFEDGNGRIGRALAEKALSQTLGHPVLLSLSRTIEKDKKSYYSALEKASFQNEITKWIDYFAGITLLAQQQASALIRFTIKKTKYLDHFSTLLSPRQEKTVLRMLEAGDDGFTGGMTATKYVSLTKASKATATRDLQHLAAINALKTDGGGRSTRYHLNLEQF